MINNNKIMQKTKITHMDKEKIHAYLVFFESLIKETDNHLISWHFFDKMSLIKKIKRAHSICKQFENQQNSVRYVIMLDDVMIGNIKLTWNQQNKMLHIGEFSVGVLNKCQWLWLWTKLMDYMIQRSQANDLIQKIYWRVRIDNQPAISLYTKFWFSIEWTLQGEMQTDDWFVDMYRVTRRL